MTDNNEYTVKYSAARRFIIKLATIAHGYGPTAARLETYLTQVIEALGYNGVFRSTRSNIIFSFWDDDKMDQKMIMISVEKGSYNMAKLARVGELVESVVAGGISLDDAYKLLEEIENLPDPWGPQAKAVSFMFIGVGFSGLMSGNLWDIGLAGILALVVYVNVYFALKYGGRLFELVPFSSAYIVGIAATVCKIFMPEISVSVIVLSAIIPIIPGFGISSGIVEIVSNHVVSGSANLISSVIYLLKQFFGAWFGIATVEILWPVSSFVNTAAIGTIGVVFFLPLLFIGLGIAYQSLIKDFLWVMVCCMVSYVGVMFGNSFGITYLGTLMGAIVATIFANLWARRSNRPTSIVLVPAITVMVSGSVGFQGLLTAASGESDKGFDQFLQMFIVALVIAAGMLVANTIVRPKVTL